MSHIQMRRNRIASLRGTIISSFNAGLTINESKLVAEISLAYGISPETILKDLKLLEITGFIKRWNNEIINPAAPIKEDFLDIDKIITGERRKDVTE